MDDGALGGRDRDLHVPTRLHSGVRSRLEASHPLIVLDLLVGVVFPSRYDPPTVRRRMEVMLGPNVRTVRHYEAPHEGLRFSVLADQREPGVIRDVPGTPNAELFADDPLKQVDGVQRLPANVAFHIGAEVQAPMTHKPQLAK